MTMSLDSITHLITATLYGALAWLLWWQAMPAVIAARGRLQGGASGVWAWQWPASSAVGLIWRSTAFRCFGRSLRVTCFWWPLAPSG